VENEIPPKQENAGWGLDAEGVIRGDFGLRAVTDCAHEPLPLQHQQPSKSSADSSDSLQCCQKVPSLAELSKDFKAHLQKQAGATLSGTVELYGRRHRVTHPISSFGMETYADPDTDNCS
jgi:hypothetical protein